MTKKRTLRRGFYIPFCDDSIVFSCGAQLKGLNFSIRNSRSDSFEEPGLV